jgi:hypothetical protein
MGGGCPDVKASDFSRKIKSVLKLSDRAIKEIAAAKSMGDDEAVEELAGQVCNGFYTAYATAVGRSHIRFTAAAVALRLGVTEKLLLPIDIFAKTLRDEIKSVYSHHIASIDGCSLKKYLQKIFSLENVEQLIAASFEVSRIYDGKGGRTTITALTDKIVNESPSDSEKIKLARMAAKSAISQFVKLQQRYKIPIETIP